MISKVVILQVLEKSATSGCVGGLEHSFGHSQSPFQLFWQSLYFW